MKRFVAMAAAVVSVSACAPPDTEVSPQELPAAARQTPPGLEYQPPEPGSYGLPPIQRAGDGRIVDADGQPRALADYMGDRLVLLSFIYTRCTDAEGCPYATANFQLIKNALEDEPEVADQVRLITLSFDPERDSPEVMRRYAAQEYEEIPWQARRWAFLTTGSQEELQPILDGYGQSLVRETDEDGNFTGNYSHILKIFLIDRSLWVRNIYSSSFLHPAIAINDLKTLLLEEEQPD